MGENQDGLTGGSGAWMDGEKPLGGEASLEEGQELDLNLPFKCLCDIQVVRLSADN